MADMLSWFNFDSIALLVFLSFFCRTLSFSIAWFWSS